MGTAAELSLPRRVQLAVVAHIRHVYTDYDKFLKQIPYQQARALAEQPTLDKMAQWRGDEDDDPNAMVSILQDVIIIPDDDDEELDLGIPGGLDNLTGRGPHKNPDFGSNHPLVEDFETRPIHYGKPDVHGDRLDSPDDEDLEAISLGHGQYVLDRYDPSRQEREQARRRRAWEEARGRHRQSNVKRQLNIIRQPIRYIETSKPVPFDLPAQSPRRRDLLYVDEAQHHRKLPDSLRRIETLESQPQLVDQQQVCSVQPPQILVGLKSSASSLKCLHANYTTL